MTSTTINERNLKVEQRTYPTHTPHPPDNDHPLKGTRTESSTEPSKTHTMDDVERVIATMRRTARKIWPIMTTLPAALAMLAISGARAIYICGAGSDNKITYVNCTLANGCACNHKEKNILVHAMAWIMVCITLVCVVGYTVKAIKEKLASATAQAATPPNSTTELPAGHHRCDYMQVVDGYPTRGYRCNRCGPNMVAYEMYLYDNGIMISPVNSSSRQSGNISVCLKHKRIYLCADHALRCQVVLPWRKVNVTDSFEVVDVAV